MFYSLIHATYFKSRAFRRAFKDSKLIELEKVVQKKDIPFNLEQLQELFKEVQLRYRSHYTYKHFESRYEALKKKAFDQWGGKKLFKSFEYRLQACLEYFKLPSPQKKSEKSKFKEKQDLLAANVIGAMGTDSQDTQCFDGAYERLDDCFVDYDPRTIPETLECLRFRIITEVTLTKLNEKKVELAQDQNVDWNAQWRFQAFEIHTKHRFNKLGAQIYGIRLPTETYSLSWFGRGKIKKWLKRGFKEKYTLFHMMTSIKEHIDQILKDYNATNRYSPRSRELLIKYLMLSEEPNVLEINFWEEDSSKFDWSLTMEYASNCLFKFFNFSQEEAAILKWIFNPTKDTLFNQFSANFDKIFFRDDFWLEALPFINLWPETLKIELVNWLIKNNRYTHLHALYDKFPDFCHLDTIPLPENYFNDESVLENAYSKKQYYLFAYYLKNIKRFSEQKQIEILKNAQAKPFEYLMFVTEGCDLEEIEYLFNKIGVGDEPGQVLRERYTNQGNFLLLAASKHKNSKVMVYFLNLVKIYQPSFYIKLLTLSTLKGHRPLDNFILKNIDLSDSIIKNEGYRKEIETYLGSPYHTENPSWETLIFKAYEDKNIFSHYFEFIKKIKEQHDPTIYQRFFLSDAPNQILPALFIADTSTYFDNFWELLSEQFYDEKLDKIKEQLREDLTKRSKYSFDEMVLLKAIFKGNTNTTVSLLNKIQFPVEKIIPVLKDYAFTRNLTSAEEKKVVDLLIAPYQDGESLLALALNNHETDSEMKEILKRVHPEFLYNKILPELIKVNDDEQFLEDIKKHNLMYLLSDLRTEINSDQLLYLLDNQPGLLKNYKEEITEFLKNENFIKNVFKDKEKSSVIRIGRLIQFSQMEVMKLVTIHLNILLKTSNTNLEYFFQVIEYLHSKTEEDVKKEQLDAIKGILEQNIYPLIKEAFRDPNPKNSFAFKLLERCDKEMVTKVLRENAINLIKTQYPNGQRDPLSDNEVNFLLELDPNLSFLMPNQDHDLFRQLSMVWCCWIPLLNKSKPEASRDVLINTLQNIVAHRSPHNESNFDWLIGHESLHLDVKVFEGILKHDYFPHSLMDLLKEPGRALNSNTIVDKILLRLYEHFDIQEIRKLILGDISVRNKIKTIPIKQFVEKFKQYLDPIIYREWSIKTALFPVDPCKEYESGSEERTKRLILMTELNSQSIDFKIKRELKKSFLAIKNKDPLEQYYAEYLKFEKSVRRLYLNHDHPLMESFVEIQTEMDEIYKEIIPYLGTMPSPENQTDLQDLDKFDRMQDKLTAASELMKDMLNQDIFQYEMNIFSCLVNVLLLLIVDVTLLCGLRYYLRPPEKQHSGVWSSPFIFSYSNKKASKFDKTIDELKEKVSQFRPAFLAPPRNQEGAERENREIKNGSSEQEIPV